MRNFLFFSPSTIFYFKMGKHKSTPTQSKKAESYFSPCKKAKTTPGPTAQGGSSAQEASSGATVAVAPKKIWTKKDLPKKLDRFSIHYPKGVAGMSTTVMSDPL